MAEKRVTLQATVDLFERAGFKVLLRNNDTHMVLDHNSGRLHLSHWPTTNTWMAWGRVWKKSTPEEVLTAFQIGRFRMPDEIIRSEAKCSKCGRSIFWAKTTKGNKMPVDMDGARHGALCKILTTGPAGG